ncbi:MAG: hypothetical protein IKG95_03960 [Bacteroidales bacterium]|nr:hypothetical protein [Bacteroidales bacterium]
MAARDCVNSSFSFSLDDMIVSILYQCFTNSPKTSADSASGAIVLIRSWDDLASTTKKELAGTASKMDSISLGLQDVRMQIKANIMYDILLIFNYKYYII